MDIADIIIDIADIADIAIDITDVVNIAGIADQVL